MKIERINELFARFAEQLLRRRWLVLAAFALVMMVSVIGMKRMVKETSFDDYFIEDDPMLVMTDEFKSHFGNDALFARKMVSGGCCYPCLFLLRTTYRRKEPLVDRDSSRVLS